MPNEAELGLLVFILMDGRRTPALPLKPSGGRVLWCGACAADSDEVGLWCGCRQSSRLMDNRRVLINRIVSIPSREGFYIRPKHPWHHLAPSHPHHYITFSSGTHLCRIFRRKVHASSLSFTLSDHFLSLCLSGSTVSRN